jgi:D-tyrosyl-tRNA(Tyr) deacylase
VPDQGYESRIGNGLLLLSAFIDEDTDEDLEWSARKIAAMRIFDDEAGVMNLSVKDVDGEILAVSQFTLMASTKKGNRPSYIKAAKPEISIPLYEEFCNELEIALNKPVMTGVFGADMQVELINDGPVTIIIDSKNKE